MWTSSLLKQNAWNTLKPYYWAAFGAEFIFAVIVGIGSYAASIIPSMFMVFIGDEDSAGYYIGLIMMYLLMVAISIAVYGFLMGVMETGKSRYFYQARNGNSDFGNMFWAFQGGRYMKVVKIMFWRYLEIMLWSLLFYIPGIIKMYEYILVPYLLAENPDLSKGRAFQISKQTMDGEKMNLFFFQLSFIGWYLLGVIACGFGVYFVLPYYDAAMTEFYACMRAKMLARGIAAESELTDYSAMFNTNQNQNMNPYQQNSNMNPYQNQNPNPYQQNPNMNPYQNQNSNPYQQTPPPTTMNPYQNQMPVQNPPSDVMPQVNFEKTSEEPAQSSASQVNLSKESDTNPKVDLTKHDEN